MIIEEFEFANEGGMNYILAFPEDDYECLKAGTETELPLIIYLHGAGERGKNLSHIYRHGIPEMLRNGAEYKAVFLCPQCPEEFVWNNIVAAVKSLIDVIAEKYKIKNDRIAITGSSMGGCGTLEMGMTYSSFFSAIAPVAADGLCWRCAKLAKTAVYMYHGDNDDVVKFINGKQVFEAVEKSGGEAEFIVLPGLGHNDGIDFAYQQTDLTDRLIKARRTDFSRVPEICEEWF